MYQYDEIDQRIVNERVVQFRDQTRRFLAGKLSEDDFRALRLRNGLYIQRYAPMLRVAIPYGLLSSHQLRKLAHIARTWDRGYAHFSTRQNIQYNWPRLEGRAGHPGRTRLGTDARHPDQRQQLPEHHHGPFRRGRAR
jgi:sulfite reductase (NADPH) hemoprotein beta-component